MAALGDLLDPPPNALLVVPPTVAPRILSFREICTAMVLSNTPSTAFEVTSAKVRMMWRATTLPGLLSGSMKAPSAGGTSAKA